MRRALLLLPFTLVLAIGCTAAPGPVDPAPTSPPTTAAPSGVTTPMWVSEMIGRINSERAAAGAGPLQLCTNLASAAQDHSADQAATSRMSHTGSNGSTMRQRVEVTGYLGWNSLGENVAAGQPSVSSVMDAWMGSSGHRANLLSTSFEHVGFGMASSSSGTPYWTQNFGRRGTC